MHAASGVIFLDHGSSWLLQVVSLHLKSCPLCPFHSHFVLVFLVSELSRQRAAEAARRAKRLVYLLLSAVLLETTAVRGSTELVPGTGTCRE